MGFLDNLKAAIVEQFGSEDSGKPIVVIGGKQVVNPVENCKNCGSNDNKAGTCQHCGTLCITGERADGGSYY